MSDNEELVPITKQEIIHQDEVREKRNLKVVYLINFCGNLCFSLITPLLWSYLKNFEVSSLGYSLIIASFPSGSALGSLLWGYWSKYAYRRPLILSLSLTLFFTLSYSFFPIPSIIGASRFFQGFGSANSVLLTNFIINRSNFENRTRALTFFSIFGILGLVVGPLIGGLLAEHDDFWLGDFLLRIEPLAGILQSLILIGALIVILIYFSERERTLDQFIESNIDSYLRSKYSRLGVTLRLIALGISFISCYLLMSSFETFLTPFFEVYHGSSRSSVSFLWAASGGVILIAYALILIVSRKVDLETLAGLYLTSSLIGVFLMWWKDQFGALFTALLLMDLGVSGSLLTLTSLISLEVPPNDVPLFIGIFTAFGYLIRSLGPIGLYSLYQLRGDNSVYLVLEINAFLGSTVFVARLVGSLVYLKFKERGY